MNEKELQKEKIRARYKGINVDEIDIIPALPEENIYDEDKEKRVAVDMHPKSQTLLEVYIASYHA